MRLSCALLADYRLAEANVQVKRLSAACDLTEPHQVATRISSLCVEVDKAFFKISTHTGRAVKNLRLWVLRLTHMDYSYHKCCITKGSSVWIPA